MGFGSFTLRSEKPNERPLAHPPSYFLFFCFFFRSRHFYSRSLLPCARSSRLFSRRCYCKPFTTDPNALQPELQRAVHVREAVRHREREAAGTGLDCRRRAEEGRRGRRRRRRRRRRQRGRTQRQHISAAAIVGEDKRESGSQLGRGTAAAAARHGQGQGLRRIGVATCAALYPRRSREGFQDQSGLSTS